MHFKLSKNTIWLVYVLVQALTVTKQVILGLSQLPVRRLDRDCLVQIYTFNLHQIVNYGVGWGDGNFHHQKIFHNRTKNAPFLLNH